MCFVLCETYVNELFHKKTEELKKFKDITERIKKRIKNILPIILKGITSVCLVEFTLFSKKEKKLK